MPETITHTPSPLALVCVRHCAQQQYLQQYLQARASMTTQRETRVQSAPPHTIVFHHPHTAKGMRPTLQGVALGLTVVCTARVVVCKQAEATHTRDLPTSCD